MVFKKEIFVQLHSPRRKSTRSLVFATRIMHPKKEPLLAIDATYFHPTHIPSSLSVDESFL
jgi:hypothetical protein